MRGHAADAPLSPAPSLPLLHIWQQCHGCGAQPIVGPRHDCVTCPAGPYNSLCDACHALYGRGAIHHPSSLSHAPRVHGARHEFVAADGVSRAELAPWVATPDRVARGPAVPDGSLVRPEFVSGRRSFMGTYAFATVLAPSTPPLVVTALHVLDELLKSAKVDCSPESATYTGEELVALVHRVNLYDVFAPKWPLALLGIATRTLILPHARAGEVEPFCQRDIAAFVPEPNGALRPMPLARVPVEAGDPIWLAVSDRARFDGRTIAATVVQQTERTMIYRVAPGCELPPYTSGAPLVTACGEVAGINIGGGRFDRRWFGHAVHVGSMRAHLEPAAS